MKYSRKFLTEEEAVREAFEKNIIAPYS